MRMDATRLRELQAPLKEKYRTDPSSARTRVRASGDCNDADISCVVSNWGGAVVAGLHPATGGNGDEACSGDMLLEALVACAGVTLRSVATAMNLPLRSAELSAQGFFDARGTLGVDRQVPVGVTEIVVTVTLDTDADEASLDRLARATERYCVVGQSLRDPVKFLLRRKSRSAQSSNGP